MNKWECDVPGCQSTAVGCGGAIGLTAIGWAFTEGGPLLCPSHRPATPGLIYWLHPPDDRDGEPCPTCTADVEAGRIQFALGSRCELRLGTDGVWEPHFLDLEPQEAPLS